MESFDMDIQPTKSNNNSTVTNSLRSKPVLHVECCLKTQSTARNEVIQESVEKFLREFKSSVLCYSEITDFYDIPLLGEHVESMKIAEAGGSGDDDSEAIYILDDVNLAIHVYQLEEEGAVDEFQEEENVLTAHHWELPSRALEGLWDNLIFDNNVKTRLIEYISTTVLFSDRNINPNIISWNRVVLLHGPPGTGKTSLCRAFAQKLAIRLSKRYTYGKLLEINSHSLFSKWFSESGKLVQKLFQQIQDMIDEEDCFVCVLIDEIESLTASRKSSLSGSDPSDAVRVVNALLTQIDKLRHKKNVLILATSNITEAIDVAFIDRADIKQFIGLPSQKAIYTILSSCIQELIRVGIISTEETLLDWRAAELYRDATSNHEVIPSMKLFEISKKCQGMSGRVLRKLPFLAHAHFLQSWETTKLLDFLSALDATATEESSSSFRT
ncbi:7021_t:CDS:10 [Ambispora leptoticha]|uniref:7021_t:CDS:1 n=1 Tax=Ambispora leptoticha TaxID=144679 RepID=A0A9N9A222_9GLOM|nr:7021_t:CDS:10 [Ambispora leptoticha]